MKTVTIQLITFVILLSATISVDSAPLLDGVIHNTLNLVGTTLKNVINLIEGDIVEVRHVTV